MLFKQNSGWRPQMVSHFIPLSWGQRKLRIHLLHKQKCELAYKFREALRNKDWKLIRAPIEEYRQIRTQLCSYYMSDAHNELNRIVNEHNAVCFPMGGGGGSVLVYAENPDDLKRLRSVLSQKFRYLEFDFIPYGHKFENCEGF